MQDAVKREMREDIHDSDESLRGSYPEAFFRKSSNVWRNTEGRRFNEEALQDLKDSEKLTPAMISTRELIREKLFPKTTQAKRYPHAFSSTASRRYQEEKELADLRSRYPEAFETKSAKKRRLNQIANTSLPANTEVLPQAEPAQETGAIDRVFSNVDPSQVAGTIHLNIAAIGGDIKQTVGGRGKWTDQPPKRERKLRQILDKEIAGTLDAM